ncbi:MAG TPA: hypothetical protein VH501_02205 [Solirubrobacterales bacterium]
MRSRLAIGLATLLVAALIAPTAHAATQIRQVRVSIDDSSATPPGTLSLDFAFKNKRTSKRKFTPRQLRRIDFAQVPLSCMNAAGTGGSTLLFTSAMQTAVKLTKAPQPAGRKPKPNRFAFRLSYNFQAFVGTLTVTIDKPNHGPRRLRSQGSLRIVDLDAGPDQRDCATNGLKQWGGLPVTLIP